MLDNKIVLIMLKEANCLSKMTEHPSHPTKKNISDSKIIAFI